MTTATITKTKNYLVIKIPIKRLETVRKIRMGSEEKKAVAEGLRAIATGRVSRPLKSEREVISFLRKL